MYLKNEWEINNVVSKIFKKKYLRFESMFKRKNEGLQERDSTVHKVPFSQKAYFGLSIAGVTFISSMIDGK